MKILFVRPAPPKETIGLQHIMIVEPLELEVLAALASPDDQCMIADMILEKKPLEAIIREFRPELVCVTGYITHMNAVKEYCRLTKSILPNTHTVTGGVHVEKFPEDIDDPSVDFRVVRNATTAFPKLLEHLRTGTPLPLEVLTAGEKLVEEHLPPFNFFFPMPRRDLTSKYRSEYFYVFHNKVALMKTSFGCPYTCRFCYCRKITNDQYFARPMDDVINELKSIREKEVYIVDDDFLLSPARLTEFIRRVREEKIDKKYLVFGRADFIAWHPELIRELKKIGLRTVIVGIESFNDRELESFEKRTSREINRQALQVMKENQVDCYAAVITSPDWTKEDFRKAGDTLIELGVRFVNLQPLTPLKGTGVEVTDEDLVLRRDDYPKWDLAHVSIRPMHMTISEYYEEVMKLYERIIFQPGNLASHMLHHSPAIQWKLAKGVIRIRKQYRERIRQSKQAYVQDTLHPANTV